MRFLYYSYAAFSTLGKRQMNEDTYLCNGVLGIKRNDVSAVHADVFTSSDPLTFAVFDGLGGEAAGEIASFLAAESIGKEFAKEILPVSEQRIQETMIRANDTICSYMKLNRIRSMGSTAAMLVCSPEGIYACNIGDSKIYEVCSHTIRQISTDHLGAPSCFGKAPLTQCLGIPKEEFLIQPAIKKISVKNHTAYLLCSDGVSDCLHEDELLAIMDQKIPEEKKAKQIRDAVKEKKGRDNATAIVLSVGTPGFLNRCLDDWVQS